MDRLTVRLAGSLGVSCGGMPETVPGRKPRRLLALLAAHRGRTVPNEVIVEELWGAAAPLRPVPAIATLVSRLRTALGQDVIRTGPDGYRLGTAGVDLDEASRLVAHSERLRPTDAGAAVTAAARALDLLGPGPALGGEPDAAWVRDVRAEHAALLRAARHAAAAAALDAGDPAAARDAAEFAVRDDALDEPAHRLLMVAHRAAGEPARALATYERLRTRLADELGTDPAPETRAVFTAILIERDAAGGPELRDGTVAPTRVVLPDTGRPPATDGCAPGPPAGRERELARLAAAWSAAGAGRAAVVLLAGEGGIGKTRLADGVAARAVASGGRALSARCYASERSLFLQPVVDALAGPLAELPAHRLRELAGARVDALAGLFPDLTSVLGPSAAPPGTAEVQLRRAYEAVAGVLRGLAADRPTLLFLDDLHNAGTATVELLHYLARRTGRCRLLVLATIRAEEGAAALAALTEVAERIEVGPLPARAVTRLAAEAGQEALAATIMRRTRGHTLFVVETLRGLASNVSEAPESLQALVLDRLHRVGAETEELLRVGSVLGASVDPDTVAAMLDLPVHVAVGRCAQAEAARLLAVAGRTYEFANDLIQEVLYTSTPLPVRVAHHRRAADLLAHAPESAAAHAAAAQDWPRAARAYLRAGEHAMGRWVAADAELLFGRALAAAERAAEPELLARALLARGRARTSLSAFRPAVGDFQAAASTARSAGDCRSEMHALRELGGQSAALIGTSMDECVARLCAGLRIAESLGDRAAEADLLGFLAVIAGNRLRYVEALELARRAVRSGRAAGSDRALARGLDALRNVHGYLGECSAQAEALDELEPLLRRLGELDVLDWTVFESSFAAFGAADWAGAEARITQAREVSRRAGHDAAEQFFVAHLGWLARLQGRLDEAVELGRDAVAAVAQHAEHWMHPACAGLLAGSLIEAGEPDEAVAVLADGRVDPGGAEGYRLRALAPLAEATGSAEVLAEADALLAGISAPPGSAWLLGTDAYLSVARAWLARGEPGRARALLAPLLGAARRLRWTPALAAGGLVDARAALALGDSAAPAALAGVAEFAAAHGMPLVEQAARG